MGDGATGNTVLPKQEIFKGAKVVSAGANPVDIQRGIKLGEQPVRYKEKMSIGLNSENQNNSLRWFALQYLLTTIL